MGAYNGPSDDDSAIVFTSLDVLRDEYEGVYFFKVRDSFTFGLTSTLYKAKVIISSTNNNDGKIAVNVDMSNPELKNEKTGAFKETYMNLTQVENKVSEQITNIMNLSESEFNALLDKTLSSLDFIYTACHGMNSVAFDKWVDDINLRNKVVSFTMPLDELEKSDNNNFKYKVRGVYKPNKEKEYLFSDYMFVNFLTNDENFIKIRKGEAVNFTGKINEIKQLTLGYSIYMQEK